MCLCLNLDISSECFYFNFPNRSLVLPSNLKCRQSNQAVPCAHTLKLDEQKWWKRYFYSEDEEPFSFLAKCSLIKGNIVWNLIIFYFYNEYRFIFHRCWFDVICMRYEMRLVQMEKRRWERETKCQKNNKLSFLFINFEQQNMLNSALAIPLCMLWKWNNSHNFCRFIHLFLSTEKIWWYMYIAVALFIFFRTFVFVDWK